MRKRQTQNPGLTRTGPPGTDKPEMIIVKNILYLLAAFLLGQIFAAGFVQGQTRPAAVGEQLPQFRLAVPDSLEQQQYLGVTGKATFAVPQLKTAVVLIEIFSMY